MSSPQVKKQKQPKDQVTKRNTKEQQQQQQQDDIQHLNDEIKDQIQKQKEIEGDFWSNYSKDTSKRLKLIDAFCVYQFLLFVIQYFYKTLAAGNYSKYSFFAGIFCNIGFIAITVCLRIQVNPATRYIKGQRFSQTFWEYFICCYILLITTMNFIQ